MSMPPRRQKVAHGSEETSRMVSKGGRVLESVHAEGIEPPYSAAEAEVIDVERREQVVE